MRPALQRVSATSRPHYERRCPEQTPLYRLVQLMKLLTRLGHLVEEDSITYMARTESIDPDNMLAPLLAASSTLRIAMGPGAGRKVLSIVGCGERSEPHRSRHAPDQRPLRGVLCANAHGFSLHAGVRCEADDRQGIEQLARYITRPAAVYDGLTNDYPSTAKAT